MFISRKFDISIYFTGKLIQLSINIINVWFDLPSGELSQFAMENHHFFNGKIHYFNGHFQLLFVCSPEGISH